jgi:hypothetical protein
MPFDAVTDDHIIRTIAAACGLLDDPNAYLTGSEIRGILAHVPNNIVFRLGMVPLDITRFLQYFARRQQPTDPYFIGQTRMGIGPYRWRVEYRRSRTKTEPVPSPEELKHEAMPTRFERDEVI